MRRAAPGVMLGVAAVLGVATPTGSGAVGPTLSGDSRSPPAEGPPSGTAPSNARLDPSVERLRADLDGLFSGARWSRASFGVLAVSLDAGDTLYARAPDLPLAPASNLKLFTAAAALHHLGETYRFSTFLLSEAEERDGLLLGDLVLYGTGDPGISDRFFPDRGAVFDSLALRLRARGIHTVLGRLRADDSYFSGPDRHPGWNPRDLDEWFAAASSALSYNENVVSVRVMPGSPGQPPLLGTLPDHGGVALRNEALTVGGRPRTRLALLRDDPLEPIRVTGEIRAGARDVWRQMTVQDPATFAAHALALSFEAAGIRVVGRVGGLVRDDESLLGKGQVFGFDVGAPRVLASHESPPLSDYLTVVNQQSHNLFADLILRTLGRVVEGEGSYDAGARVVERFLRQQVGVAPGGVYMVDGSGLAAVNRASPAAFVRLLAYVDGQPYAETFWNSLPEAGSRSLRRMRRTAAAANLRAKTGTIDGVSSLSGVVRSSGGERIAFSILGNDLPSETGAKRIEDLMGVRLATFERAVSLAPDPVRR